MVVTKTFVWAHLAKAGGDTVATVLSLFPEIIEYADSVDSRDKHARFADRPDLVAGRQRVLCIRRLPAWQLSYSVHKSRHGSAPDYRPQPMDSRETMITSGVPDRHLKPFVEAGEAWPDRWIRVEHLIDDVLALLEEHHVEVTPKKLKKIRALRPQNVGQNYERDLSAWFTDEMISRMYEHNPLWQHAEHLAYGSSLPNSQEPVVVTKTFVWAHLPKTAGDTVATIFAQFPEIVEFADPLSAQAKHALFSDRPDLVAGRRRILCIRRLPSWHLSYANHKSHYGLHPGLSAPADGHARGHVRVDLPGSPPRCLRRGWRCVARPVDPRRAPRRGRASAARGVRRESQPVEAQADPSHGTAERGRNVRSRGERVVHSRNDRSHV